MKFPKVFVKIGSVVFAACIALPASAVSAETPAVTASPASYAVSAEKSELQGKLPVAGATVFGGLVKRWAEKFAVHHPRVNVTHADQGFTSGALALMSGSSRAVLTSRPLFQGESSDFRFKPVSFRVAVDTPAVFVHKDNPLRGLTQDQVRALFNSLSRDSSEKITRWGQLGLTGEWADRPIRVYNRKADSDTAGMAEVVKSVGKNVNGIALSSMDFEEDGVRALPVARETGGRFVEPTAPAHEYPLSRVFYLCFNKTQGESLDPLASEFVRFVLSREGQQAVAESGYSVLAPEMVADETGRLNLLKNQVFSSNQEAR